MAKQNKYSSREEFFEKNPNLVWICSWTVVSENFIMDWYLDVVEDQYIFISNYKKNYIYAATTSTFEFKNDIDWMINHPLQYQLYKIKND